MKCLCAICVDRNQQTFLEQMMSFVVQYDIIYHSLPISSQYLMIWGGGGWGGQPWPCDLQMTAYKKGLLMHDVVQLTCLAANDILLMQKWNLLFSSLGWLMRENGRSLFFPKRFWLKNKLSDRMCLADQCLADQLFLCSPLKHQDIFRLPSSIIIVNCLSLKD